MSQLQAARDIVTDAASEAGYLFAPVKSKAMWFFGLNLDTNQHLDNLPVELISQRAQGVYIIIGSKLSYPQENF